MASISDKFGRASLPTSASVATTVKATRTAGVLVLEAHDLSKFATDTPVFFVTYKKNTDPATGDVSAVNVASWKALVNPGTNTLTNLTIQPGFTDTGNNVGDFIECIPTSAWENNLIDGLLALHTGDGQLKDKAVTLTKLNGGSAGVLTSSAAGVVSPSGAVTTDTNPGTAGGSRNCLSLGVIKLCWGRTDNITNPPYSETTKSIVFPTSFFSSTPACVASIDTAIASVGGNILIGSSNSADVAHIYWRNNTPSAAIGGAASWIAVGV